MRYKLVIFDFDGTLANTYPWVLTILDTIADLHQVKRIDQKEIEALRTMEIKKMLKQIGVPLWKLPIIGSQVRSWMTEEIHKIPLFEGIDVVLKHLSKEGIQLAVVSSNSLENVRAVLGPENDSLINYYQCSVSLFGKQSKFRQILKKSGIANHETICIGDEIRDIEAAKKANIPSGAVSWGYTKPETLQAHSPAMLFSNVLEIVEKIT